jgi:hypothetical protein
MKEINNGQNLPGWTKKNYIVPVWTASFKLGSSFASSKPAILPTMMFCLE